MEMHSSVIKQAFNWTTGSFALLRLNPGKWMLLALVYVIVFSILPALQLLPLLVKLMIGLSWPLFLVLAIGMLREADAGRDTDLGEIVESIKPYIAKLITLGGMCLVYSVLVSYFTKNDMNALAALTAAQMQAEPTEMLIKTLPLLLKLALLLTPLLMATWFSPMLIAFNSYSILKAIKSSLAGCLKYMLVLGATWLMLTMFLMLGIIVAGMFAGILAVFSDALGRMLIALILLGSLLMAIAWMLAFQFLSYRDIYKVNLGSQS